MFINVIKLYQYYYIALKNRGIAGSEKITPKYKGKPDF
jgi:hypothetical protein